MYYFFKAVYPASSKPKPMYEVFNYDMTKLQQSSEF